MTTVAIILLKGDLDPTWFWWRNSSFLSQETTLFLRVVTILLATFHGSLVMTDLVISTVNGTLAILFCLQELCITNGGKYGFYFSFLKYRQISVLTTLANQVVFYIVPVGLLVAMFNCVVSVYFVIKLSAQLPVVVSLFSICLIIAVVIVAHVVVPMCADVKVQSANFTRAWKLRGCSAYRTRQLRSCRALGFWVGPFFVIGKQTRGEYLELVLYHSVTLLMSV